MYRATLTVTGAPQDTWLDMSTWGKGVAFVNGFNLGRYWVEGPTKTVFLPAPLLQEGANEVRVTVLGLSEKISVLLLNIHNVNKFED